MSEANQPNKFMEVLKDIHDQLRELAVGQEGLKRDVKHIIGSSERQEQHLGKLNGQVAKNTAWINTYDIPVREGIPKLQDKVDKSRETSIKSSAKTSVIISIAVAVIISIITAISLNYLPLSN